MRFCRFVLAAASVLSCETTQAQACTYALVVEGGWYKAIDATGRVVADSLRPADMLGYDYDTWGEGMFPYVRDGRVGFKNARNELVIPPVYWIAAADGERTYQMWKEDPPTETRFRQRAAVVRTTRGKFGIVNRRGELLADTVYDYISAAEPRTGVYAARRGDTLCILTAQGKGILPPHYRTDPKLYPFPKFRDGMLCAMVPFYPAPDTAAGGIRREMFWSAGEQGPAHRYKVGFLNTTGVLVIDTIYRLGPEILRNSEQDYASYTPYGSSRRYNLRPNPDPYYLDDAYYIFRGGRCLVHNGRSTFVISTRGDSLYTLPYSSSILNSGGFFIYQVGAGTYFLEHGIVNRQGKSLFDVQQQGGSTLIGMFHKVEPAGHGLFLVESTLLPRRAPASLSTDAADEPVYNPELPLRFLIDSAGRVRSDNSVRLLYAWAKSDGAVDVAYAGGQYMEYGSLDKDGSIRPHSHSKQQRLAMSRPESAGLAAYQEVKDGLWGYRNRRGKVVIPPRFNAVLPFFKVRCADAK